MTDEITIIEDNGPTVAPENKSPYHTDVESMAWRQGRSQAKLDNETDGYKERSEQDNPYTSADTMVAWSFGYDSRAIIRFDVPDLPEGVTNPYGTDLSTSGTEATAWQRGYFSGVEDTENPSPFGNMTENPYDDVRIPHWAEGYIVGSQPDDINNKRPNPYLDGDREMAVHWYTGHNAARLDGREGVTELTEQRKSGEERDNAATQAWTLGYDDWTYEPAPFNPADIDSAYPTEVFLEVYEDTPTSYSKSLRLVWRSYAAPADKPAWALNRVEDRSVSVGVADARRFRQTTMNHTHITPEGSFDLPCPPYEYEYTDGGLKISSGVYGKWGSKDDWENVLEEMQQQVENMPTGLNIEDTYIEVTVTVVATQTHSISIPISALVETDDGSVYTGSMDDLESDVDGALDGWGDYEIEQYLDTDEVDWNYADTEISEWNADDTGYDIRNGVSEL